jgi:hypothetical protein
LPPDVRPPGPLRCRRPAALRLSHCCCADQALATAFAEPGPWIIVAKLTPSRTQVLEPADPGDRSQDHLPDVYDNALAFTRQVRHRRRSDLDSRSDTQPAAGLPPYRTQVRASSAPAGPLPRKQVSGEQRRKPKSASSGMSDLLSSAPAHPVRRWTTAASWASPWLPPVYEQKGWGEAGSRAPHRWLPLVRVRGQDPGPAACQTPELK